MNDRILAVLLASAAILMGAFQILGSILDWRAFADPPEEWDRFWFQSFVKRMLGSRALPLYNYVTGVLMIALGIGALIALARGTVKYK